jgi:hypothetical protein
MVFRSAKAREFLCICKARNEQHALEIAGRMFRLERTAWANIEDRTVATQSGKRVKEYWLKREGSA